MKRTFVFVLLLLLCTFLHGCSSKDEMNSTNRELEDMNILSEEDIAWFNTEYFNSGNGINMRNMMLSDTAQNGLNEFLYLEEYDAYYLIHSDLNYVPCNIMSGMRNKDGNVILEYEMAGKNATVTLKENKSEYYFVSNTVNS